MLRTEVFELIQYAPQTEQVREVPLLFAPPTINKYYVLDLAPGRSMIEWLVQQGQQVFAISWRNPDVEQGHFDLDTYAAAVLEARDAVAAITGQPAVHLNGACSGGIISAGALGHLAAEGRLGEIASLTPAGRGARQRSARAPPPAFAGRDIAAAAVAESARRGYLDGQALARRVHLAAAERPGLELRRQQLPARQGSRRRSTSCTGTRTPSGSPPACTATSSSIGARELARASPARSRCSAARSTSAPSTLDSYVVAG